MSLTPNCPEHNVWYNMHLRCGNPNAAMYRHYGGRGIKVCKRWNDFFAFVEDMGRRPKGKSLDRIDNDGDYTPKNCRWATNREQGRNRRTTGKLYKWQGVDRSVKEISDVTGVTYTTLRLRLKEGMTIGQAVRTKARDGGSAAIGKDKKSIATIAKEEGVNRNSLAREFRKHGDIKRAITTVKKNAADQALISITVGKRTRTLDQWAEELGTTTRILRQRIRRGMSPELAVTKPV